MPNGYRKIEPLHNPSADTDHLPMSVEKRPARVAPD